MFVAFIGQPVVTSFLEAYSNERMNGIGEWFAHSRLQTRAQTHFALISAGLSINSPDLPQFQFGASPLSRAEIFTLNSIYYSILFTECYCRLI